MAMTLEPTVSQPSVWFEGDVDPQQVPERYRLGDAFVPKGRYLDREFLELELDRVFTRTWLMACRLEELPGVGSYVEYVRRRHLGAGRARVARHRARRTTTHAATAAPASPRAVVASGR